MAFTVDSAKLTGYAAILRDAIHHCRGLARMDEEDFRQDPHRAAAARYYLMVGIEAAIDIGQHVVAAAGLRSPQSYADVFAVLRDAGVIGEPTAQAMQDLAQERNRIVHGYAGLDNGTVRSALAADPDRLEAYLAEIGRHLDSHRPS